MTDEEVKSFYEQSGPALIMPETRSVEYVKFAPPAERKALEGREKWMRCKGSRTLRARFLSRLLRSSFEKAAAAKRQTIQTSPDFDRSGATSSARE